MGDLQGLMVSICILSKHGSWSCTTKTIQAALAEADTTIITFILAFFNFQLIFFKFQLKLSSRVVYIFQLSTNILYFLPEIGRRSVRFCLWYSNLVGARLFLLSRHLQSSSSLYLISPRVFPRQNWFILVLIK